MAGKASLLAEALKTDNGSCAVCGAEVGGGGLRGTLVEMTKSLRFQPNFLMASPMTISLSPAA
jgi:threonine dehydratase